MKAKTLLINLIIALYIVTGFGGITCNAAERVGTSADIYSEEELSFEGDEAEQKELVHFLLAKLVYDNLNDFEGKSIRQYIEANGELYDKEIWEGSGITYTNLYNKFIGDFVIYKIYDCNSTSGFYGVAFTNSSYAILAFRGSEMSVGTFFLDENNDWTGTDFKFALLNKLSRQFDDSVEAYNDFSDCLIKDDKVVDITFAGHSLGGALVTNASILTGCYGYSFDGACGHVIDLVYYYNFLDIDGFTGVEDQPFCNYTDDTGYLVADIIQHTNADAMYQLDRKTKLDKMTENTALPKYSTGASHIIWSTLTYDGATLFFTDKCVKKDRSYTYEPADAVTIDITKNVIEAGTECFSFASDKENWLATALGAVKTGRVMLASNKGSVMRAYDDVGVNSSFAISAVMYGGSGNDKLYGFTSDDVLVAGDGNNVLDGGMGTDTYIIDKYKNSTTYICDFGEDESYIVLRNFGITDIKNIKVKDNVINFGDGQTIKLSMKQKAENIKLFAYDEGNLTELGDMSMLPYKPEKEKTYTRIVMLKGKGEIKLTDGSGHSLMQLDSKTKTNKIVEKDFCRAYICGEKGKESILLFMDGDTDAVMSSERRIDAAFGRIDAASGKIICGKLYKKKFENYMIDFYDSDIMNQEAGEIGKEDAVDSGLNYLLNMLFDAVF